MPATNKSAAAGLNADMTTKKPDLVKQQLDRIRRMRPGRRAAGKTSGAIKTEANQGKRTVDEYENRDAAARPNAPRDPVALGAAVDELIEVNEWGRHAELATVMATWDDLVGSGLAEHVKPIGFEAEESILVLQADSTVWATQVRLFTVEILQKIDEAIGSGVVASIEVKGPEPVRKVRGRYRVKGRGPRDTYG